MTSSVQTLSERNFWEKFDKDMENNLLVVLEFTAPWSDPCKFMKPKLERLAKSKEGKAQFYALDINEFKGLADWLDVETLPTFVLVREFRVVETIVGVDKDKLAAAIDRA